MREGYIESPLGVIPVEWEIITVKDATLEHKQGYYTKDEYSSNGVKLVRITDLDNPKVNFSTMPSLNITEKDFQDFKVEKGDFLFARSGAIGRYGIVEQEPEPAIFASYLIRFRFNQEYLLNRYFGYFFESSFCKGQLASIAQGNANININAENIKSLKVPLPPFTEQQKVTEILSAVDEKIEVIDEKIKQTQQLKKGLLQKLLTKGIGHTHFKDSPLGQIPEGWQVITVKEATLEHKQGYYTKEEYTREGVKLVRITDLGNPKVNFNTMPSLNITEKEYKDFKIEKGDFLFARSGAIGRYGIVEQEPEPAIFASYLIRFRFNQEYLLNRYFGYFFESSFCSNQLSAISQGNANININAENIKSLKTPLPPLNEQQAIVKVVSSVDEKLDVLQDKKDQYQELKKGLMQQLLTGKLRVNHLIEQPELA